MKFTSIESIKVNSNNFVPVVSVIGVGGAGNNMLSSVMEKGIENINFIAANTDKQVLDQVDCENKIQLGKNMTKGLGAGANPEIGIQAAEESIEDIKTMIQNSNILFIICGMGGGTGTGASSVIARVAKELGIITISIVTKPFSFEGQRKIEVANDGIQELKQYTDTLVQLSNQKLFDLCNNKTTLREAFDYIDSMLYNTIKSVADLINLPGMVNLDFNDIKMIIENSGYAVISSAEGSGEKRVEDVSFNIISNPLIDDLVISEAQNALLNITGSSSMTLFEIENIVNNIKNYIGNSVNFGFGAIFDESMEDRIRVSLIATGFSKSFDNNMRSKGVISNRKSQDFKNITSRKSGILNNIKAYNNFELENNSSKSRVEPAPREMIEQADKMEKMKSNFSVVKEHSAKERVIQSSKKENSLFGSIVSNSHGGVENKQQYNKEEDGDINKKQLNRDRNLQEEEGYAIYENLSDNSVEDQKVGQNQDKEVEFYDIPNFLKKK